MAWVLEEQGGGRRADARMQPALAGGAPYELQPSAAAPGEPRPAVVFCTAFDAHALSKLIISNISNFGVNLFSNLRIFDFLF